MMNFYRQYQTAILFIVAVVALYGGYTYFFAQPTGDVVQVEDAPAAGPDQDLVALLFQLKGIRLDEALFKDPIFKSLQDFGKDLVQEPIGRHNPFAPLGSGAPEPVIKVTTKPKAK